MREKAAHRCWDSARRNGMEGSRKNACSAFSSASLFILIDYNALRKGEHNLPLISLREVLPVSR